MSSSSYENDDAVESKGKSPRDWLNKKILLLAVGSIGVVFGDIGTSPLYAIKACFHGTHAINPRPYVKKIQRQVSIVNGIFCLPKHK